MAKTMFQEGIDRGLRIVAGLILIALGIYPGLPLGLATRIVALIIGGYSLITGSINFCPLNYLIFQEKKVRRRKSGMATLSLFPQVKDLAFFNGLSKEEIETIFSKGKRTTYGEGEEIMGEGVFKKVLHILYSGKVKIIKKVAEGETKTLGVLEDGETFGEMSFFDNTPPSASVISVGETHLLEIEEDGFRELLEERPELTIKLLTKFLQISSSRIRELNEQIANMGAWWVSSRKYFNP